ncbi:recombinase family protein [Pontibacter sp. BT310]|uniref:Recombinase family protein n=2 Tax=Hymenobacteraceae TaxID=1853232 RepID=A0ABS6XGB6_9BACT|nr:recombinase family protein [Pontibacter sp. BT310]MBJ6120073.1 recombinase family protein [Pontibacter sp. BT310]MBR0572502.1 recombinase family protein [Microvirga sp. STS03]MBW3366926.1 recombinase family protein [Pontibacter populi]
MSAQKYVVYYRVSTKKQGESGLGLEAQRTYVEHFYSDKNIIQEYTEKVSGKDVTNRPQLLAALDLCKREQATLVVAKIDRLSRDTEQALSIYRELDGRLESCDVPNLDKFTLTLFMAIADRERELISIRTKGALVEKRKQVGEWRKASEAFLTGTASAEGTKALQAKARTNGNNRRAAAMIEVYRSKGMIWMEIADKLNEAGFRASRGGKFQATQVQRLYERATAKA